ncbi:3-dehydroquinate synthase [Thalassotalea sp. M1531]|uniref:3-dehydroquinate synthase n=1 Tax=Thalassotalea algicola TaxID=2716224 RepID=A0A7Y0Q6Y3_9GAMM|nr:3-dehydroquinate synthase [Thalassotalea algicola]NMP30470.1 3-dehydroquinate synthase [Thalassotalea algicola]
MNSLLVDLGDRSYPIYIEAGLLNTSSPVTSHIKSKRVTIVSNDVVFPIYGEKLISALGDFDVDYLLLPDGEQEKNLANFDLIMTHLLEGGHGRDSTLIALGGGVIGDITGFAAACYQRGVDFIQIPTTLLSQVDSSVGGKTAINHPLGKNMVGAFYQPNAVIIDIETLSTLPAREFSAGMAEVIKYGILGDKAFFDWLEENKLAIKAKDSELLKQVIARCCQCKADIVAEDEKEAGKRALLNLGHTFGHAIEAEQGYGVWLHGEAVATGMVLASTLSEHRGLLSASELRRIIELLAYFELPIYSPEDMDLESYLKHMKRDKKNIAGQLRFVLPKGLGDSDVYGDVTIEELKQLLD